MVINEWQPHFYSEVVALVFKKYNTWPGGMCTFAAVTIKCTSNEGYKQGVS
jgi:hypothetical protein